MKNCAVGIFLSLAASNALAEDQSSTEIHITTEDVDTSEMNPSGEDSTDTLSSLPPEGHEDSGSPGETVYDPSVGISLDDDDTYDQTDLNHLSDVDEELFSDIEVDENSNSSEEDSQGSIILEDIENDIGPDSYKPIPIRQKSAPEANSNKMKEKPVKKDKSSHVLNIQRALNATGEKLELDGILGSKTTAAIKRFQSRNKLRPTGQADASTLAKLKISK